ncbi:MAG TPA: hypothetical protein VJQ54_02505 [Candidatus Sulfotelmatobacter sp.]|nr:hypothetical protein [Candidatus Sulfotelmatobacter sp.]
MLQAHSLLWHYLWVAPNVLLLGLGILLWKRKLHSQYPFFFAFSLIGAAEQLILYISDILPSVSPGTWWFIFWACLVLEGLLKFGVIAEIFAHVFGPYRSVAKLGKTLIQVVGTLLLLLAVLAAAYAPKDSLFGIVSGAHLLEQAIYLIETGLLLFIFLFCTYFHLTFERKIFGIALGFGVSACVHLATWAILANGGLPASERSIYDLINMAAYHACIIVWFYYLLTRDEPTVQSIALPENNLALWNRELERLLQ